MGEGTHLTRDKVMEVLGWFGPMSQADLSKHLGVPEAVIRSALVPVIESGEVDVIRVEANGTPPVTRYATSE